MSREKDNTVTALTDLCGRHGVKSLVQVGAEDGYEGYVIGDSIGCHVVAIEGDSRAAPMTSRPSILQDSDRRYRLHDTVLRTL